jgi:hypothetical protein
VAQLDWAMAPPFWRRANSLLREINQRKAGGLNMTIRKTMQATAVLAFVSVAAGLTPVLAEEKGQGMMEQDHMGGMMGQRRGKMNGMADKERQEHMKKMDKQMQDLNHHMKMMEGVKNPDEMMTEMKKHMQLMTNMMDEMLRQQEQTMGSPGGMEDH